MARLPVYKKIQGKGWEEVREEPMDPQAQLRHLATMNEWMGSKYRILQAEAEELRKQRDTIVKMFQMLPDPDVQAEKEARSDGDQIIKEIMESLVENIAVNQKIHKEAICPEGHMPHPMARRRRK